MTSHIKISVITPSYNQGQFLEETIRSVLNQNYPNLEYIIIDGGSTDNSVEIIKKYEKNLSYWISENDKGQSHAFNKGFEKSSGEIIGWINSDDIYYPGAINEAVEIFSKHPEIDIIFSNYYFIDEIGEIIRMRKEIPYDFNIYLWTKGCYHANVAGFFRRKCFEKFGVLREDLQFGMDYELYLRFGLNGCKFLHSKSFWGAYRFHGLSKSISSYEKQKEDGEKIFKEYLRYFHSSRYVLLILPTYFKYLRYIKKLLTGCYF